MNRNISWLVSVFALLPAALFPWTGYVQAQTAGADPVVEWNANMLQAISTTTAGGLFQARWAAIVHASIYDAVVSFTGDAEPYGGIQVFAPRGASVEAAVIAAAHYALVHLFPNQQPALDAQYGSSLGARGLTISDSGIEVGEKVAAQVLALRAMDGSATAQFPYTAPRSGSAGVWVPTPPAFAPASLPGWGRVTPWVMRSQSQFRVGPPPALDSDLYAMDVNEVKAIGAQNSGAAGTDLYDPANGKFSAAEDMTIGRHSHTATLLPDGTVLIAGGYSVWLSPNPGGSSSAELYVPRLLTPPSSR